MNPHLNQAFDKDYRIKRNFYAWKIKDPPANCVKPFPISVIHSITYISKRLPETAHLLHGIANMIIIALFFLLCLGEYTNGKSDTTTFTIGNVQMFISDRRLDLVNRSDAGLYQSWSVYTTFTTQNNGVDNEVVCMGLSGHHYICVVKAIKRRVCCLQSHNATLSTPLARVYTDVGNCTAGVTPHLTTKTLHEAVTWMGAYLGSPPSEVSTRYLCAAGAMDMLVAKVDPDIIQILVRWRSDEIF